MERIRRVVGRVGSEDVVIERHAHELGAYVVCAYDVTLRRGTVLLVVVAHVDASAVDELELCLERIGMRR